MLHYLLSFFVNFQILLNFAYFSVGSICKYEFTFPSL